LQASIFSSNFKGAVKFTKQTYLVNNKLLLIIILFN